LPFMRLQDRTVSNTLMLIWMRSYLSYKYSYSSFLKPRKITLRFGLKPILTCLILSSLAINIVDDVLICTIKYREGYVLNGSLALPKPKEDWSLESRKLLPICDGLLSVVYALFTSSLFLFQAMWHHTLKAYVNFSFQGSKELKVYVAYTFLSCISYLVLQFVFQTHPDTSSLAPQILFTVEMMIFLGLSIFNHIRLCYFFQNPSSIPFIRRYTRYILRTHLCLIFASCLAGPPLLIADLVDYNTPHTELNHVWLDMLYSLHNYGYSLTLGIMLLAIHPPYHVITKTSPNSVVDGEIYLRNYKIETCGTSSIPETA
ncbi:hypothetical protein K7432_009973, partial [Basidiobolus ranarum]